MIDKILNKVSSVWELWKKVLGVAALTLTIMVCGCNRLESFDGVFVAFDAAKSSVVSIDAEGEFTGSYTVHYTGPKPAAPIVVSFEVKCGDGLAEGRDYKVATAGGKITFLPGVYDQVIKIDWLPHDIDVSKDNTVTVSLVSAEGVTLGYPGPDKLMKDLVIRKYSSK